MGQKKSKPVPIRTEYLKLFPFKDLDSRLVTATVLSFYGDSMQVSSLLQKLSHTSRAYIHNAKGLKGFLVPCDVKRILQLVVQEGKLESIAQFQHVEMDEVLQRLADFRNETERLEWLGYKYPCLFVHVTQSLGMERELQEYKQKCQEFENDCRYYSYYVHGYFIPWVQQQREEGKLFDNKSRQLGILPTFRMFKTVYAYRGEIERSTGNFCGFGVATNKNDTKEKRTGFFLHSKFHGFYVHNFQQYQHANFQWHYYNFECKNGKGFGKYNKDAKFGLIDLAIVDEKGTHTIIQKDAKYAYYHQGKATCNAFDLDQNVSENKLFQVKQGPKKS